MTNKKSVKKATTAKKAPAKKVPVKKIVRTPEAAKVVFPNDIASKPVRRGVLRRWFGLKKS